MSYSDTLQQIISNRLDDAAPFALCPLDGRYVAIAKKLSPYFSDFALNENRVKVEVLWFIAMTELVNGGEVLDSFDPKDRSKVLEIAENFSLEDYFEIKKIESKTNHDVKAVEIFVRNKLTSAGLGKFGSFVHFGCTSEDITNVSYALMIKNALKRVLLPEMSKLINTLADFAIDYEDIPMMAHTHGQKATPTTVGKEFAVHVSRFKKILDSLEKVEITAKFNGATGNYSADSVAYPGENWPVIAEHFITDYVGLSFNQVTTQIEPHGYICEICDLIRAFNNVLIDFDLDIWLYVSMNYLKQIPVKGEVGSSTMPHKINPIKFENSESNVWFSNALLIALSDKLPRSRMQRDLSDSSTQRNIGLAFGYALQAISQTNSGLSKITINEDVIKKDLDSSWEVLAEPIQTVMRKYGLENAYDRLKELTRGKNISKEDIQSFILSLDFLSSEDKATLLELTPSTYTGLASEIVDSMF